MDGSIMAAFGHRLWRQAVTTGNNQNLHDSQIPATAASDVRRLSALTWSYPPAMI